MPIKTFANGATGSILVKFPSTPKYNWSPSENEDVLKSLTTPSVVMAPNPFAGMSTVATPKVFELCPDLMMLII